MAPVIDRRQYLSLLASTVLSWPLAAHAQERGSMRRIGFLTGLPASDPEGEARLESFLQGLAELGWSVGHNVEMDYRAARRDPERYRKYAEELVALKPDLLLAGGAPALAAFEQATRTVPIVFANATDQVGTGYLARLARPRRNTTGFLNFEPVFGWRWLELLKQLAPHVTRVAILRSAISGGTELMGAIRAVAPRFGVELTALEDHDAGEIERGIAAFVHGPNHGMIVTPQLDQVIREQIIALAARYRLPAVYPFRRYVAEGGLVSYGTDQSAPYRQAAGYVDLILKGARPIDLPVQEPKKYETVLNMKTAVALGLKVPPELLTRADEVIE